MPKLVMPAGQSELEQVLYKLSAKYKSVLTMFNLYYCKRSQFVFQ